MTTTGGATAFDAVVLAGGRARRLGGVDKPGLDVSGRSMAARVVGAAADASRVVLVGPGREDVSVDVATREDPPGSGPVSALAAGVEHVTAPVVVTLAADLPFVTGEDVRALVEALLSDPVAGVAVAVDDEGADQWLLACWRTDVLRPLLAGLAPLDGMSLRRVYRDQQVCRVRLPSRPGAPPWFDCDTPDDVDAARARGQA
ncbi:MAG: molybdenum cofactor guanylyltransferase [Actinomycetes bacterium]